MSATIISDEPTSEALLKALIIYDDFALATKANSILERAMELADGSTRWNLKPWRLDVLNSSQAATEALAEAADAHLVLLALRKPGIFPAPAWAWLEHWATHRRVPDAAIAVFDGVRDAGPADPVRRELSQFAQRHGLTWVGNDRGWTENESAAFMAGLYEREAAPAIGPIPDHPSFDRYQGWGINE